MARHPPHFKLADIQKHFSSVELLRITKAANDSRRAMGLGLSHVLEVIQVLRPADFRRCEPAHTGSNHAAWHDSYVTLYGGVLLYLKFAGVTLKDLMLTSFEEVR